MSDSITEWEFTADAASWINEILVKSSRLPFSRAKCEQRGSGSAKRRDLTLINKDKKAVLTGEVKLPWAIDGRSPYNEAVVQDARQKAKRARVHFFFTWNVNEFVLWETDSVEAPLKDRQFRSWPVTLVNKPEHLEVSSTIHALKTWLADFLAEFANIYLGAALLGTQMPDEKFLRMLEAALHQPIFYTQEELEARYQRPKLKAELDQWMKAKGWLIVDDPEGVRDNLERAAKYACYALVNKIVFHEALLKRYAGMMEKLSAPEKLITQGEDLRLRLEGYFQEAKIVTADYETVFGEDHTGIGNRIPFYSDHAVPYWRDLINQIHDFDFSRLDYEVIGNIFERLLSPGERKKYGQFYTRVEVVDLINSFCITSGLEKVMDPACGGGTFLVRAYARKREQAPRRKHGELLSDLFGVDIDEFATNLTTINLATRDLIDAENYPQIVRSDFLDIEGNKPFMELPIKGLGKIQHRKVELPRMDAVIGNPPYVRQEQLRKAKNGKAPEKGTKEYYQDLVRREAGADLSGRSDIHCYFWPHAASFLKEDGYLCFLTSSQWLDVEYGFHLQDWILRNFEIVAVFESIDEPWFVGARVATTVTILRRQEDAARRMANNVRFVQLRRPIREILAHDGTTGGALKTADGFRDEILALPANTVNERYRARLLPQGDLWREGVRLGVVMGRSQYPGSGDPEVQDGDYYGGKWGIYLRAPDLWFELLDNLGTRFTPLGDIAEVRFGVKTGNDSYFFPIDASDHCLAAHPDPTDFKMTYAVSRKAVESGQVKLVRCGEDRGEIRPIEVKYLEPEVHNLMQVNRFSVDPQDCSHMMLFVSDSKDVLKTTLVHRYIRWAEKRNVHMGSTVAGRATKEHEWYDLTLNKRADIILPKIQQYRLISFLNPQKTHINSSLLGIYNVEKDIIKPLCAILNSTISILSRLIYARILGNEGNIQLDVYSAKMMLVPNIVHYNSPSLIDKINLSFDKMLDREVLGFIAERRLRQMAYTQAGKEAQLDRLSPFCELDMADRRGLDDAVLEMLGMESAARRQDLLDELYDYLREFFELTRQKEEKAIINKNKARRRGQASPTEIAAQILAEIQENYSDLLRRYDPDFLDLNKPFDTFDLPGEGAPQALKDTNPLLYDRGVVFLKGKKPITNLITKIPEQDTLIMLLARSGSHGLVRLPHDPQECQRLYCEYAEFLRLRDETIRELIANRTLDEEMQEKIYSALMPQLLYTK